MGEQRNGKNIQQRNERLDLLVKLTNDSNEPRIVKCTKFGHIHTVLPCPYRSIAR
jgi:hypothetical protein